MIDFLLCGKMGVTANALSFKSYQSQQPTYNMINYFTYLQIIQLISMTVHVYRFNENRISLLMTIFEF
jgi:hypothetical protein